MRQQIFYHTTGVPLHNGLLLFLLNFCEFFAEVFQVDADTCAAQINV